MYHNKFYRFCEFGRQLVYHIEGANAFFLSSVEARLLDYLQEGKSLHKSINALKDRYTNNDITKAIEHIKRENLLINPHIPYQELSHLYTLDLNIIQKCNLRCKYCYVETPGSSSPMNKKTAQKAVDFILACNGIEGVTISFYGGEPLLNYPVIKSTMEYASEKAEKKGIPVTYYLTTNGTLLTDDIIHFFTKYKINIEISIDGPASIHDFMRVAPDGKGTHALVVNRIQKLINTKGIHTVSASGLVTNYSRLKDTHQYLSQFPFKNINISCVRPLYNNEKNTYSLTDGQKKQYLKDMQMLARECFNVIMKGVRPPYYIFEKKILDLWKHTISTQFCPAGLKRFGISPVGDVYPCGFAADREKWKLGTLNRLNTHLVDTWLAHASHEDKKCTQCWAHYLCVEKCPLQPDIDETRCEISRHSTRLAIAIYAAVKEQNEMMFASLIDEDFLLKIREKIKKLKNHPIDTF